MNKWFCRTTMKNKVEHRGKLVCFVLFLLKSSSKTQWNLHPSKMAKVEVRMVPWASFMCSGESSNPFKSSTANLKRNGTATLDSLADTSKLIATTTRSLMAMLSYVNHNWIILPCISKTNQINYDEMIIVNGCNYQLSCMSMLTLGQTYFNIDLITWAGETSLVSFFEIPTGSWGVEELPWWKHDRHSNCTN